MADVKTKSGYIVQLDHMEYESYAVYLDLKSLIDHGSLKTSCRQARKLLKREVRLLRNDLKSKVDGIIKSISLCF